MDKFTRFFKKAKPKADTFESILREALEKQSDLSYYKAKEAALLRHDVSRIMEKFSKKKSLISFDYSDIIKSSQSSSQRKTAFANFVKIINSCVDQNASTIEGFLQSLSRIQKDSADSIGCTDGVISNSTSKIMASLQFILVLNELVQSWESHAAGFAFEGLLALGLKGQRIPPKQAGFSVVDLVVGNRNYSVKFVKEGKVVGSMKYLAGDLNLPIMGFKNKRTILMRPPGQKPFEIPIDENGQIKPFKYSSGNQSKAVQYIVGLKTGEQIKFYHKEISIKSFNEVMAPSGYEIVKIQDVFGKVMSQESLRGLIGLLGSDICIFANKKARSKYSFGLDSMTDIGADLLLGEEAINRMIARAEEMANLSLKKMEQTKATLDDVVKNFREFAITYDYSKGNELIAKTIELENNIKELIKNQEQES